MILRAGLPVALGEQARYNLAQDIQPVNSPWQVFEVSSPEFYMVVETRGGRVIDHEHLLDKPIKTLAKEWKRRWDKDVMIVERTGEGRYAPYDYYRVPLLARTAYWKAALENRRPGTLVIPQEGDFRFGCISFCW